MERRCGATWALRVVAVQEVFPSWRSVHCHVPMPTERLVSGICAYGESGGSEHAGIASEFVGLDVERRQILDGGEVFYHLAILVGVECVFVN